MKRIRILIIALILILVALFFNQSYAANETRSLGAQLKRPFTDSEYKFRSGTNGNDKVYTVVKVYDNEDKDQQNNLLYSKALYCLRGGVGFGADDETDVSEDPITYTEIGEMHADAAAIIAKYEELYNVDLDRTVTINQKEVNIYNAILWILDEAYLPTNKLNENNEIIYNEEEYKEELLTKIGIAKNSQEDITKDDLEVMQQLAIWYFANYDEQSEGNSVSTVAKFPAQFLSINDNNNIDFRREENLNKIYQYFIYNAIDNSAIYQENQETSERSKYVEKNEFDKDIDLEIKSVDYQETIPDVYHPELYYYEIGPFKVKSNVSDGAGRKTLDLTNITLFDADGNPIKRFYEIPVENEETGEITSGGLTKVYTFVNSTGVEVTELEKGIEYYIRFKKVFEKGFQLGDVETLIPEEEKYDISTVNLKLSSSYSLSTAKFLIKENVDQPIVEVEKEKKYDSDELNIELPKEFDLSLRKYISAINGVTPEISRVPEINTNTLINGIENRDGTIEYTATYTHPKNALEVKTGDKVIYTIRVYNEGELDGIATQVTDYLPDGLEFVPVANSQINSTYGWTVSADGRTVTTNILGNEIIKAFDRTKTAEEAGWQKAKTGEGGLYYKDLQIECEVIAIASKENQSLRNIAAITEDTGDDRDSIPGDPGISDYNPPEDNSTYKEDDDDYEDLVLPGKEFDLSLRKYITEINGTELETSRIPQIDTSKLNTIDSETGEKITTATYKHAKNPVTVKKGDLVTYKIRIYNEGQIDGYATKVTDYLPDGLGFLYMSSGDINSDWFLAEGALAKPLYGTDGIYSSENEVLKKDSYKEVFGEDIDLANIQVIQGTEKQDGSREMLQITAGGTIGETQIKATDLIKSYGSEVEEGDLWQQSTNNTQDGLFYQELEITCIVLKENTYKGILTNVAEITEAEDLEGSKIINPGDDRDSEPNNVYEDQNHTPGTEIDGYTPGEQDDDDFEPLQLKYFDLALRKFITGVETKGKTEDVTTRIPVLKLDENGIIVYEHSKEPVYVANNDTVIYTIRVYNEGTIAGYAEEITDDIPEGLEYLPEHSTNKQYEWVMIDKDGNVTKTVEDAVKITTDYLSKDKETATDEEEKVRDNLIDAFDSSKAISVEEPFNPDYRDVKVAFKVTEPNTSDRIIINSAQISEDSDDDIDSVPDEWNDGEDDQDKEYIYVRYFDLSLLKWVTKTVVTVEGTTTTTETGFKPNTGKTETTGIRDNNEKEPIAKVELDRKKLSKTTVKFVYKIRVTNEGEIEGYATEITDFIPEGLEFKEEDNKTFGWVKEGDNKVTTRALETVLLKPGESAEVEIIFTWKNDTSNLGLKTNVAEITEDYNEHNSEDIDSVPDNKKDPYEGEQEDDDDFALVILSIKTGKGTSYVMLITAMTTLLASGIYLVKRYVLTY